VVNDGDPYDSSLYPSSVKEVIQHTKNKSVGVSKNEADNEIEEEPTIDPSKIITREDIFKGI
jgi:hypothetical protein